MITDTLLEQTGETKWFMVYYESLKMTPVFDDGLLQRESWMDDLNENGCGPEDETEDDSWMDDLDEAA